MRTYYVQTWFLCDLKEITQQDQTVRKKLYEQYVKDKYYVPIVLEDSTKCVRMWRDLGITCLQPNDGKF